MSNCCGISNGDRSFELDFIKLEAKEYAVEHQKTVAIYQDGEEFKFGEFGAIEQAGFTPIEVVSKYL